MMTGFATVPLPPKYLDSRGLPRGIKKRGMYCSKRELQGRGKGQEPGARGQGSEV